MTDTTIRTVDTIAETPVFCACCGSVDGLEFEQFGYHILIRCRTCGFFWDEEG